MSDVSWLDSTKDKKLLSSPESPDRLPRSLSRGKVVGARAYNSPLSSAAFRSEWSHSSTILHSFMACAGTNLKM